MDIVCFSNFINHHQKFLADEIFKLTNGEYIFVETMKVPDTFINTGYPNYSYEKYVLRAWESNENMEKAKQLACEADVAMFDGYESLPFELIRSKNPEKLSFEVSERWFKRGYINLLSPRFLKWYYNYIRFFRKCNTYKLCCSAYLPNDMYFLHAFKNRCFKWGYFTKVTKSNRDFLIGSSKIKLMWCARFIKLKKPELAIKLVHKLVKSGYDVELNMFGSGKKIKSCKKMVEDNGLSSYVHFMGNLDNNEILRQMSIHDIFLFTSDKNEGWGAVANEAMSNGCILVGSNMIGSVPFLINDGINGLIFKTNSLTSLYEKVEYLINNPQERSRMASQGQRDMYSIWSPENAAKSLLQLISDLKISSSTSINYGPGSKATPIVI